MKTENLIQMISVDREPSGFDLPSFALVMAGLGLVAAMATLLATIGIRPDILEAMGDIHFLGKFVIVGSLLLVAMRGVIMLARPAGEDHFSAGLFALPVLVVLTGIVLELFSVPKAEWQDEMLGDNATLCLVAIPLLSLLPLIAMLLLMRHGAPTRPVLAGGLAGLAAGAIGALVYAAHCTDDSPLFVAVWYTLGIIVPVLVGIIVTPRLTRW